jgi:acetyl-CoA carboxylase/biotin carboxylase 1
VSLKAREVLILVQMPSFDERFVQMENILKAAVVSSFGSHTGDRLPNAEVLKELSDSRYTVFDVLPAFFNNEDPWMSLGKISYPQSGMS